MQQNTSPEWLTFDERMTEAAGILAAGIIRRRKRQMKEIRRSQSFSTNGLDVFVEKSVHCTNKPLPKGENR
ncbi:MAG: hypothetical protein M1305_08140 [Candidatus Marsarchaeota archaeon]|nr:hypothetical protein [Candidatus Marsarchaeota archaeon]